MKQSNSNFQWLILVGILAVLGLTNPDKETHVKEATNSAKHALKLITSKGMLKENALGSILGMAFGGAVVEGAASELIERKNYLFFSLTTFLFDGRDQIIGLGILGNVFIFEQFQEIIKTNFEKLHGGSNESANNSTGNNSVTSTIIDNQTVSVGDNFQGGIVFFAKNGHVRIVTESELDFRGIVKLDFENAKEFCSNLQVSNFDDWYLPDEQELSLIRSELYSKKSGNFNAYYLSSTLNGRGEPIVVNLKGIIASESGGHINDEEFRILAVRKVGY